MYFCLCQGWGLGTTENKKGWSLTTPWVTGNSLQRFPALKLDPIQTVVIFLHQNMNCILILIFYVFIKDQKCCGNFFSYCPLCFLNLKCKNPATVVIHCAQSTRQGILSLSNLTILITLHNFQVGPIYVLSLKVKQFLLSL